MIVGYFQSEAGQFGCINCDSLGDFHQEWAAQTSCTACAKSTQRYVGVLSAANRSSCQCKEGVQSSPWCLQVGLGIGELQPLLCFVQATTAGTRSRGRCCQLFSRGEMRLARRSIVTSFAGVREVYYTPLLLL